MVLQHAVSKIQYNVAFLCHAVSKQKFEECSLSQYVWFRKTGEIQ